MNEYLKPLLKWWRLLIVATLIAMVLSFIAAVLQPSIYLSRTTLMIGRTMLDPNPEQGQIYIAQQLAAIYADMAKREPIQAATMQALGIEWLPNYQVRVVPNTQLIEISVSDTIPERAQIIAGELANQLILQSPTVNDSKDQQRQDFIKQQLSSMETQIQETQKTIEDLQKSLVGMNSASQIASTEKQINELTLKLSNLRTSYASLLTNTKSGALNILSIVEPATIPIEPVGPNVLLIVTLASAVALFLSTGAAYLIEYLDRTIKTSSDVLRVLNFPVIGYFSEMSETGNNATFVLKNPTSDIAENFRVLRSNIEFFKVDKPVKSILMTSPNPGNGKTTLAINLALSMAQGDKKVILVDADLRRPAVHKALKMQKSPGLSEVIRNQMKVQDAIRPWKDEGLNVITAGSVPPNITELVGSKKIASILTGLKEVFDVVIVDAPPLLISDAYNLASKVDGVILVMEPGQTQEEQARFLKEHLDRADAKVIGVVLNRIPPAAAKDYGNYRYQSAYSKSYGEEKSEKSKEQPADTSVKKVLAFFEHGEVPPEIKTAAEHSYSTFKRRTNSAFARFRKSPKQE